MRDFGGIGLDHLSRGSLDQAEKYTLLALEINEDTGEKEKAADNCATLGLIYRRRGDRDKAEEYYLKSLALTQPLPTTDTRPIHWSGPASTINTSSLTARRCPG